MKRNKLVLLGVRGSSSCSGEKYKKYGVATSCVLVKLGEENIIFDAGSGILNISEHLAGEALRLNLLLTHTHVDHICGLPVCQSFFCNKNTIDVYGKMRNGLNIREQIDRLMSPPLWPVNSSIFSAKTSFNDITTAEFCIGEVKVYTLEGNHPGGCTVYKLIYKEISVVFATDYEEKSDYDEMLLQFAKDCTVLIIDGQYSKQKYISQKGFGHSTWEFAAQLGQKCRAKQTIICHHSCFADDAELDLAQEKVLQMNPNCRFGRCGEEYFL